MPNESKIFQVSASALWQNTDVYVNLGDRIQVAYRSGRWTCNPSHGYYDGNGISIVAKGGYAMPGANEGSLIGKVGAHRFYIGNDGYVPNNVEGLLELIINDDLAQSYGRGYRDNKESIKVDIIKYL